MVGLGQLENARLCVHNQGPSSAIKRHQAPSSAIKGDPTLGSVITNSPACWRSVEHPTPFCAKTPGAMRVVLCRRNSAHLACSSGMSCDRTRSNEIERDRGRHQGPSRAIKGHHGSSPEISPGRRAARSSWRTWTRRRTIVWVRRSAAAGASTIERHGERTRGPSKGEGQRP